MARVPVNQPYTITTGFGVPDSNALFGRHSGIDYGVPLNRRVFAPVSGVLTNEISKTGGNMVRIFDGKYHHRLMHNESFSRGNGRVNEGDEVALAGTTGLSTGVHVHWDVATKAVPTSFSDFIDPNSIIGGAMSKLTLYQARILDYFVAGNNGYDGFKNSLKGENDAALQRDWVGKETGEAIDGFYTSNASREWYKRLENIVWTRDDYKAQLEAEPNDYEEIKEPVYKKKEK